MGITDKIKKAKETTWLSDYLTEEERITAKYIAKISTEIHKQRIAKGYTQQEFAKLLRVSQAMVSRWENGEENFTVATLVKISTALEIELFTLVEMSAPLLMVASEEYEYKITNVSGEPSP